MYSDASGKNPLLIAIGIGALIGGVLGGIDALIKGEDFLGGVVRGAIVGAVLGALVGTGNAWAAGGVIGKSLIQASLTRKGHFLSNFNEYAFSNTVPASVGAGFVAIAKGDFNLSETFGAVFTWVGVILTVKDINETACDEDNASEFARNNVCIN